MFRRFISVFLFSSLFFFTFFNVANSALIEPYDLDEKKEETDPQIKKLQDALSIAPNFLQYTEYKMLSYKKNTMQPAGKKIEPIYYSDYIFKPKGSSPLSLEFTGGRESETHSSWFFTDNLNVLTGIKAIDETMQLGSMRWNGGVQMNNDISESINIAEIESLSIKSHPWEEMIKDQAPQIPNIFTLVPKDYFMVYFKDLEKFTELENTLIKISQPLERIYSLNNTLDFKDKMFKRLGIKDIEILREFIDEAVMVSYDLDAYPNTDYALILKVKNSFLDEFIEDFVESSKGRHGSVGDYYVIATDENTYETIAEIAKNKKLSIFENLDLKYTLSVLENDYDGFAFFSEDLIRKLTSPAYRINGRRRNVIINALEALQYTVFAYRDITGEWPDSLSQIVQEGYIAKDSIANIEDYTISEDGLVIHKDWNTIYDVTPISRVAIEKVSSAEKDFYDNFRDGYESYWVEYIDPIGVAITVGDQIRFHTVILPLIDESEYNWWKSFAAGDPVSFEFISNPLTVSSFEIVSKFNINDVLYAIYQDDPDEFDEDYKKCKDNYYGSYNYNSDSLSTETMPIRRESVEDTCKKFEKNNENAAALVTKKLFEAINWEGSNNGLDFIGNEIALVAGESLEFKLNDLSKFDFYFGLKLNDIDQAKDFINHVFKFFTKELGSHSRSGLAEFIGISGDEPIKNEYKGVEFYMIPTGFTNIFYVFIDDVFYFTLSQHVINKIIDGKELTILWQDYMFRLFDYIGMEQNVMAIIDFEKMQKWLEGLLSNQGMSYLGKSEFQQNLVYYTEALILAKTLPGYEGTVENVGDYYRYVPEAWFDAQLYSKDGIPYIKVGGTEYDARTIDAGYFNYYAGEDYSENKKVELEELTGKFDIEANLEKWKDLKDFGIGLQFTKDGLDIKLAFTNLENSEFDSRIKTGTPESIAKDRHQYLYLWLAIAGGVIILTGLIIFIIQKKNKTNL